MTKSDRGWALVILSSLAEGLTLFSVPFLGIGTSLFHFQCPMPHLWLESLFPDWLLP